ncbi:MAG: TorF family putative porin [Hyphomonadaceae bacterium]|nr:TorF family putative porin [Hyphomonadaceae bacterium]
MRNLLVLSVIAAATAAPAFAQEVTVTGNIALATDYAYRGISQSDGPAVQGGFDAAFGDSGFYLGTWASNINFGGGSDLELDVYGGYKFALGGVAMDVGVLGYLYPNAQDDGAELDYWELYAKPSFAVTDQFTLGAGFYYSPEFTGETGDGFYYEVNGAYALTPELALSGAVGVQTVDTDGVFAGEDDYTTWNVGGTYSAMGLGFDLRYVGTDVEDVSIYDDRVIFSIKKAM